MDNPFGKKYRIIEQLDSGGMAYVFKALNLENNKTVALKMLKPDLAENEEYLKRFRKEAEAVMSLNHENIVHVYDIFEENGYYFMEMEYLEGETLKDMIKRQGILPAKTAINIAIQVCHALIYAHSRNIIHRDIKPQNIMIKPNGRAVLMDFGIAVQASGATQVFSDGSVLGSVYYFSPEQAQGANVDEKSDLYSLGIVLYEMATGSLPFKGENSVSVALKHIQEEITPPEVYNPKLSKSLSRVIMKATQKQPEMRYLSANEMEQDLKEALRNPLPAKASELENTIVMKPVSAEGKKSSRKSRKKDTVERKTTFRILRIISTSFLFIGMIVVLILIGQNLFNDKEDMVYVPKFVEKSEAEAIEIASRQGLKIDKKTENSETVAEGVVVSQAPAPGQQITPGSTIKIVISAGKDKILAPNLVNMQYMEAAAALSESGLTVGEIHFEANQSKEGTIISQDPTADTQLDPDSPVDLWISGEDGINLKLPMVSLMQLTEAKKLLQQNGFKLGTVKEEKSTLAPGTVIRTLPEAGTFALVNSPVDVTISAYEKKYTKQFTISFSAQEDDSRVIITLEEITGYEFLVYDSKVAAGRKDVVLSLQSATKQKKALRIYVNGESVGRQDVEF